MLRLKDIVKNYYVESGEIKVLKGMNVAFRKNEFVSILGPSGCGKTTTLNIVGGLDKYTSGDLIIGGKSTKNFSDRDWDTYRNERIGFIFQSYNLIPHQTVLGNVELALTIAGVSKEERVRRALSALEKVGLKGQEYKKPNQLSGGQCQRVAIARALVNEPDILLADEPTGALDSKTSVQIMELIKEISKEKLVIMVTHNADIAAEYSTRIVRLVDGEIVEDTNPYSEEEEIAERSQEKTESVKKKAKKSKAKMSWWTAFKLSMRNLFTKKGRTVLTSFAGSIGIIGISLILAVSQGTTAYINSVQESTLSSYPITLEQSTVDLTSLMQSFMGVKNGDKSEHDKDAVYKDRIIADLVNALSKVETGENDLKAFKIYIEEQLQKSDSELNAAVTGVQYSYDFDFDIYTENVDGDIVKSDTAELMSSMIAKFMLSSGGAGGVSGSAEGSSSGGIFSKIMTGTGMWEELLPAKDGGVINDLVKNQYDMIYGEWPNAYNEVVLVVNEDNEIDDLTLYALGLIGEEEIDAILEAAIDGRELEDDGKSWSYEEVCGREFKTIMAYDRYKQTADGTFSDWGAEGIGLQALYDSATSLKITGIIRPNPNADNHMMSGSIGYTYKLTERVIAEAERSEVVKAQLADPNTDVLTGLPFKSSTENLTDDEKDAAFREYAASLTSDEQRGELFVEMCCVMPEEMLAQSVEKLISQFKNDEGGLNRDMLVGYISQMLSDQLGTAAGDVGEYFADLTDDELLNLITPYAEDIVKEQYAEGVKASFVGKSDEELSAMLGVKLANRTDSCAVYYDEVMKFSDLTYEENLAKIGYAEIDNPSAINIYAASFKDKDVIVAAIDDYNEGKEETEQIKYTDYMGIMMSSITTIIDAITYVLIAFVAISLVVSSIMIAVIILISVQERTKEIGILRSIGASKKDVSNLFNAETIILGLASGLMGVGVTYLLCIPINFILQTLTGLSTLKAVLPISAAAILVAISVGLNLISGLIPSKSAAKKDPVVALRTE